MAYRLASESANLIAGFASVAGMMMLDWLSCQPAEPVNYLHIHGTADEYAPYWGGALIKPPLWVNSAAIPGAVGQMQIWAAFNGASNPVSEHELSMDLDLSVPGLDTVVTRYTNDPPGGAVELWTIQGGTHLPQFSAEFSARIIDWLLAHPKP